MILTTSGEGGIRTRDLSLGEAMSWQRELASSRLHARREQTFENAYLVAEEHHQLDTLLIASLAALQKTADPAESRNSEVGG